MRSTSITADNYISLFLGVHFMDVLFKHSISFLCKRKLANAPKVYIYYRKYFSILYLNDLCSN